jgi:hypothetical protein
MPPKCIGKSKTLNLNEDIETYITYPPKGQKEKKRAGSSEPKKKNSVEIKKRPGSRQNNHPNLQNQMSSTLLVNNNNNNNKYTSLGLMKTMMQMKGLKKKNGGVTLSTTQLRGKSGDTSLSFYKE